MTVRQALFLGGYRRLEGFGGFLVSDPGPQDRESNFVAVADDYFRLCGALISAASGASASDGFGVKNDLVAFTQSFADAFSIADVLVGAWQEADVGLLAAGGDVVDREAESISHLGQGFADRQIAGNAGAYALLPVHVAGGDVNWCNHGFVSFRLFSRSG